MSTPAKYEDFAAQVLRRSGNVAQPSYVQLLAKDRELRDAIGSAVREYSRSRSLVQTKSINGDGTKFEWVLDDEAGWSFATGFSDISQVKITDDDATERERLHLLPGVDYEEEPTTDTPAKTTLRLLHVVPATTSNLVVTFTRFHQVDDTAVTIPEQDIDAVISLCAAGVCEQYTVRATSAVKAATGETSDLSGAVEAYGSLAVTMREAYNLHIFGNKDGARDVGSTSELLPTSTMLERRPLHHGHFHRRRPA